MLPQSSFLLNAFLLVVVQIIALDRLARKVGLTDKPSERKVHEGHVPLTGGIAMFSAFLASLALLDRPPPVPLSFLAGLSLLVILGVADDLVDIRPGRKLAIQIGATLLMIMPGDNVVRTLPDLFGTIGLQLDLLALPFTCVFVIGLINAYNMIDGLDGLAGGMAAAALFWLAAAASAGGHDHLAPLVLLFATLGFLVFNMRHPWRARSTAFMGDAGSMMLGAAIAFFTVAIAASPDQPSPPTPFVALLWVSAIPAIDTLSLIVRRLAAGHSPFRADRRHIHHVLLDMGLSHRGTTAVLVAASFMCGAIGVLGARLGAPTPAMIGGLVILAAVHGVIVQGHERRIAGRSGRGTPAEQPVRDGTKVEKN